MVHKIVHGYTSLRMTDFFTLQNLITRGPSLKVTFPTGVAPGPGGGNRVRANVRDYYPRRAANGRGRELNNLSVVQLYLRPIRSDFSESVLDTTYTTSFYQSDMIRYPLTISYFFNIEHKRNCHLHDPQRIKHQYNG
ncbi:hypothetical protein Y032_0638g977 [Ancylostoma ceylanicum]|nr:hypothetical protein Y032_0638g977 [Ancylostoma ceylanicum]